MGTEETSLQNGEASLPQNDLYSASADGGWLPGFGLSFLILDQNVLFPHRIRSFTTPNSL